MSEPIRGSGTTVHFGGQVFNLSTRPPAPEEVLEMERLLIPLQRGQLVRLPDAMRIVAAERIAPGLPVTFDAAGRVIRWEPVPPIHFADEPIEPGDVLTVMPDGAVRLADRAEAARRAAVERAIERHAPPDDDAPLAAAGDVSPGSAGDGADAAVVARADG